MLESMNLIPDTPNGTPRDTARPQSIRFPTPLVVKHSNRTFTQPQSTTLPSSPVGDRSDLPLETLLLTRSIPIQSP